MLRWLFWDNQKMSGFMAMYRFRRAFTPSPDAKVQDFLRARVEITRHSPGSPDYDGLVGSAKLLLDLLTTPYERKSRDPLAKVPPKPGNPLGLGFVVDDGPRHIQQFHAAVVCARDVARTVVRIEELAA